MIVHKMTYGDMPTRWQFDQGWNANVGEHRNHFAFGNDKRLGTCDLTREELWEEIQRTWEAYADCLNATSGFQDPEIVGDWLSTVLYALGIEWV